MSIGNRNVLADDYTPEPQVDGDIVSNDGQDALVLQRLPNGDVKLLRYTWQEDRRYKERGKGHWSCCTGWVQVKLTERKILAEAIGK